MARPGRFSKANWHGIWNEASSVARPQVDEAIAKSLDTFFGLLAKNQIDKAYEHLILGTKIAERIP